MSMATRIPRQVDVLVAGAGIAGLAAADALCRAGHRVLVVEPAQRPGGKARTAEAQGFRFEMGPHTFVGKASHIHALVERAGLRRALRRVGGPAARFVYRDGRLRRMPSGLGSAVFGDWLSPQAKLRLLAEPWVAPAARPGESAVALVARRLGPEAAAHLLVPFVGGIYAGDAHELGAEDAFPTLAALEREHGSLLRGALRGALSRSVASGASAAATRRRGIYSLRGGFGQLTSSLAAGLPDGALLCGHAVCGLAYEPEQAAGPHRVQLEPRDAHGRPTGRRRSVRAARVIVAAPARPTADLLRGVQTGAAGDLQRAATLLDEVVHADVAVVHLGGPDPTGRQPQGFGTLIPRGQGVRGIGILYPSSMFPERAPPGHWLHAVFLGGIGDAGALELSDDALVAEARATQGKVLAVGPTMGPLPLSFRRVQRWRGGIPQYTPGHRAAMRRVRELVSAALPGVALAGNHLEGVSVDDAARTGLQAAAEADLALRSRQGAPVRHAGVSRAGAAEA